jgi:hypothetical protein
MAILARRRAARKRVQQGRRRCGGTMAGAGSAHVAGAERRTPARRGCSNADRHRTGALGPSGSGELRPSGDGNGRLGEVEARKAVNGADRSVPYGSWGAQRPADYVTLLAYYRHVDGAKEGASAGGGRLCCLL